MDYNGLESVCAAIHDGWWPMRKTCKFMLACLVHKDNKDISLCPITMKSPPGHSCIAARQEKEQAISEERSKTKTEHLVPTTSAQERYGNIDHAIKKLRVAGMKSHVEMIAVDTITSQVNMLCEN